MPVIIYNDIYHWEGLGKKFGLAVGKIRLWIFNLKNESLANVIHLRPIIVVVSDVAGEAVTVKGWAGPLASFISREFNIDRHRMMWVEYYPPVSYGAQSAKYIPEKFEMVEFAWKDDVAMHPQWRLLKSPLRDILYRLIRDS